MSASTPGLWTIFVVVFMAFSVKASDDQCSLVMFGGDTAAYWACKAEFALQSNWFPSPIAGLFSYLIWNGFDGFWQNGAVLEPITNFIVYANHTRYKRVIQDSYRDLYSLLEAYGPYPSFDDMGWYAMSYLRIYETQHWDEFLQSAEDIFNWSWQTGWDTSGNCSGGFWFDNNFDSKQTITNVEMLKVGAHLYRLTGNSDTLNKVHRIYDFLMKNDVINETTYLISGGVTSNCTPDGSEGYTYNSGVFIGALVELYKIDQNLTFIELAVKLADGILMHRVNKSGALQDVCEPNCDEDGIMFKGIFARNLRYLIDVLPHQDKVIEYRNFLYQNVKIVTEKNICDSYPISKCNITFQDGPPYFNKSGPVFSPDWTGPFTVGAPMQQTSALDLFVSAIGSNTTCKGKGCEFDPAYPPPQPLTCSSHPCPSDEVCCEYSPYTSYTCCYTGQKCIKDICT